MAKSNWNWKFLVTCSTDGIEPRSVHQVWFNLKISQFSVYSVKFGWRAHCSCTALRDETIKIWPSLIETENSSWLVLQTELNIEVFTRYDLTSKYPNFLSTLLKSVGWSNQKFVWFVCVFCVNWLKKLSYCISLNNV